MYCGQCGKKVLENMLFCPFCGAPIVIPDQDEAPAPLQEEAAAALVMEEASAPETVEEVESKVAPEDFEPLRFEDAADEPAPDRPVSLFEDYVPQPRFREEPREAQSEPFVPLRFDFEQSEPAPQQEEKLDLPQAPQPKMEPIPPRPARRVPAETLRPENNQKRAANTYIPVKELAPDDIFMDEIRHEDDYDDDYDSDYDDAYDRDDADERDRYIDDFEFEEQESGGFFQRHIRGVVGLILLLVLAVICAVWAFSPKGQLALARVNLAWSAEAYADLGYDAYMQNSDLLAARYYEKALARQEDNYEYAHSAMVAYYEADEIASAAAMLKKCIEMDPDNPEPYQEMLVLYPDAADRPWEITELIRLGYQRTGDPSLQIN